jgi:serpin B
MKKVLTFLLSIVTLVGLGACLQPTSVESNKDRIMTPDVNKSDLENLVDGNNTFAMYLFQSLRNEPGNIFYSPYSISSALAMTFAGARGETETQMAETLRFLLPQDRLHPAFNSLALALASRGKDSENQDEQGFRLNNVNALWGQNEYRFLPAFLDVLAQNYGAGMRLIDFVKSPDESRVTINNWVSEQTQSRIQGLLPPGSITPMTRLVLTNAIYFKAAWFYQFKESNTASGDFHLLNSSTVTAQMMKLTEHFDYTNGSGYQAVELMYRGRELSMVLMVPDSGKYEAFEKSLDYPRLKGILSDLKDRKVILAMPKFTFSSDYSLSDTLKRMGMPAAFASADFTGMAEKGDLVISGIYHKAFVAVDEKGTEAAAATAVIMVGAAPNQPPPVELTIDRPFIFLIRDIKTGTILFIGRVINPEEN